MNRLKEYKKKLVELLSSDLNFHDSHCKYPLHNFHSFPAKFPPQLPGKFITSLTEIGDSVLDPMMGSGTTVLEAGLCSRRGIGCDIDPLYLLICQVKTADIHIDSIQNAGIKILANSEKIISSSSMKILEKFKNSIDRKTIDFIDYWFAFETQTELAAILSEIEKVKNTLIKNFFKVLFSSIIITKSGGVSLSFDLAHTRPHRASAED
jgi:hypothetical protein